MLHRVTMLFLTISLLLAAESAAQYPIARDMAKPIRVEGDLDLSTRTAVTARASVADTTLRYYEAPNFVLNLGGDIRSVHLTFEAPISGRLSSISFPLYNGPLAEGGNAAGVAGTGTLRVKLSRLEDVAADPSLHPLATPGLDSLDVDFSSLTADENVQAETFNTIDLGEETFAIEQGEFYSLALILVGESDDAQLTFLFDAGSEDTSDDRYYPPFMNGGVRSGFYLTGASATQGDGIYRFGLHNNVILELTISTEAATAAEPVNADIPEAFSLAQNYPNPFNPATTITFSLPQSGLVTLRVYDMLGRHVDTLVQEVLQAGTYSVHFDASGLPSGSYLYRLESGDYTEQRLLTLVR